MKLTKFRLQFDEIIGYNNREFNDILWAWVKRNASNISNLVEAEVKPESGGLSLEVMIDNLPQNRVLYKDSGLWMIINEEDFNTVDKMLFQVARYQQTTEETFTQFIKRCFDNENEYYITEG